MIALAPDEAKALPDALDELRLLLKTRGAPESIQRVILRALPARRPVLPSAPEDIPLGITAIDVGLLLDGLSLCASMLADPKEARCDALLRLSRIARNAAQSMLAHLS